MSDLVGMAAIEGRAGTGPGPDLESSARKPTLKLLRSRMVSALLPPEPPLGLQFEERHTSHVTLVPAWRRGRPIFEPRDYVVAASLSNRLKSGESRMILAAAGRERSAAVLQYRVLSWWLETQTIAAACTRDSCVNEVRARAQPDSRATTRVRRLAARVFHGACTTGAQEPATTVEVLASLDLRRHVRSP
jgi:hypothetical protein